MEGKPGYASLQFSTAGSSCLFLWTHLPEADPFVLFQLYLDKASVEKAENETCCLRKKKHSCVLEVDGVLSSPKYTPIQFSIKMDPWAASFPSTSGRSHALLPPNSALGDTLSPSEKLWVGTSLVVQWLRLCFPLQRVRIWSLVRELRTHMPHGQQPQNIKQKQYCNKFNKDFKNDLHQKIKGKKTMSFNL